MLEKLKKSHSSKTLNSYKNYNYNNNPNKDTDYLTSRCYITPSMTLINCEQQSNKYLNEKVIIKITSIYLEIIEKINMVVIKSILLKDIKEFNYGGSFWEIIFRNENDEFIVISFNLQKANIIHFKVMDFLKIVKKEEEHNSEIIQNYAY